VNWFTATPLPDDLLPGRAERRSTTPRDSPCTMATRRADHGMPGHRMATATPSLDRAGNIAVRGNYVGRHREASGPAHPVAVLHEPGQLPARLDRTAERGQPLAQQASAAPGTPWRVAGGSFPLPLSQNRT
jgi:hypothetical protein